MSKISAFIDTQFPTFYHEGGKKYIEFVKAYYEWLEEPDNVLAVSQDLSSIRDIDRTADEFIIHFKNKYLTDFPFESEGNIREIIKRSLEIYRSKGTDLSIQLLIKLLFDEEANVYYPGRNVLYASGGNYNIPHYLEATISVHAVDSISKEVTGEYSHARAIVENIERIGFQGKMIDKIYLSNIRGDFRYGERISHNGDYNDRPRIIGSLTDLVILTPGRDFIIGQEIDVISDRRGRGGRAVITSIDETTGQVTFELIDGGYGYTRLRRENGILLDAGSDVLVADDMFSMINITNTTTVKYYGYVVTGWTNGVPALGANVNAYDVLDVLVASGDQSPFSNATYVTVKAVANTSYGNTGITKLSSYNVFGLQTNTIAVSTISDVTPPPAFNDFERVIQYQAEFTNVVDFNWTAGPPLPGEAIVLANSTPSVVATGGYVVSASNNSVIITSANNMYNDAVIAGVFGSIYNSNTSTASGLSDRVDISARAIVVDSNTSHIGFYDATGSFTPGSVVPNNFIHGLASNTYAQLATNYFGQGANFSIGSLDFEEQVYLCTDFIGGNNFSDGITGPGIPYLGIKINDKPSGQSWVEPGQGYNSNVGSVIGVYVVSGGTGYAGSGSVTVTGGDPAQNAVISYTASAGVIQSCTIDNAGWGYDLAPTLAAATGGTPAVLKPIMVFGYGFPKLITGNFNTIISECLTRVVANVGQISQITNINPGEQYNIDPFVKVLESRVAGYNRKDLRLIVNAISPNREFVNGEIIEQTIDIGGYKVSIDGSSNNGTAVANIVIVTNTVQIPGIGHNATTNRLAITAHGFSVGHEVNYTTSSTPIGGLVNNTPYYIKTVVDPDTIELSLTSGGAIVDITGDGTNNNHFLQYTGGSGYTNASVMTITGAPGANALALLVTNNHVRTFVSDSDVNGAANTITLGLSHGFVLGNRLHYLRGVNDVNIGLTNNTNYYVSWSNASSIAVSATPGGANVDLTTGGSADTQILTRYQTNNVLIINAGRGYPAGSTTANNTTGTGARFTVGVAQQGIRVDESVFQLQQIITRNITSNSASWSTVTGTGGVGVKVNGWDGAANVVSNGYILSANSTKVVIGFGNTAFSNNLITQIRTTTDNTINATVDTSVVANTANINAQIAVSATNYLSCYFYTNQYWTDAADPIEGVTAFMHGERVYGRDVGASANIVYAGGEPLKLNAETFYKGQVYGWSRDGDYGSLLLKRLLFNLNFSENVQIRGTSSGATANVVVCEQVPETVPIGLNANVTATAGIANGVIASVRMIDSGIGYRPNEIVTLTTPENIFTATALVSLIKQGYGTGVFRNKESLLNYSYLHDSNYYQEYSYEIQTGISLDKYEKVIRSVTHPAGTKMFGNVRKSMVSDSANNFTYSSTFIDVKRSFGTLNGSVNYTTDVINMGDADHGLSANMEVMYIRPLNNTHAIGLTNNSIYYVANVTGTDVALKFANDAPVPLTEPIGTNEFHYLKYTKNV